MSKINQAITNRAAPVKVFEYGGSLGTATHTFKNMDEFEAWYKGERATGRFLGANSHEDFTDIMIALATPEVPVVAAKARSEQPPRTVSAITVNGAAYRSAHAAFTQLMLPFNFISRVRKELKASGVCIVKHDNKEYKFEVVGAQADE
jgi:hypothetical protein